MRISGTWSITSHRLTGLDEQEVTTLQNQAHTVSMSLVSDAGSGWPAGGVVTLG